MTVISFDSLTPTGGGTVAVGTLSGVNFGALTAFNAAQSRFGHMASSSSVAAKLDRGVEYSITREGGGTFDFIGASFGRSHAGGLYRLTGLLDGEQVSVQEVSAFDLGISAARVDVNFEGIDQLKILFFPSAEEGIASMDGFEFELTP